jgi:hypothetical protein
MRTRPPIDAAYVRRSLTKAEAKTPGAAEEQGQEVARTQEVVDSQEVVDMRAHREAARSTAAAGNLGSISGPTAPLDAILAGKGMEHTCST